MSVSAPVPRTRNAVRPATDRSWAPIVAAGVTVVLWASAFVFIRAAGRDFSPGALTVGRMLVGAVVLSGILLVVRVRRRQPVRLPRGRVLVAVLLWGIAWFGLYNLSLNTAEQHRDAGTTALVVNVAPVIVAVLAWLFLGEGFPRRLMVGLAVAFAGVALIASAGWTGGGDLAGVLLALAAAVLYAGSAVVQKRLLVHVDPLTLTWLGAVTGAVVSLPFLPALLGQLSSAPTSSILAVLYLGAFPTAVAFLTWGYALARTSAGRLATSTYLVPPLVVLMSWVLLGETPALLALAGGVLCLAGVAVATARRRAGGRGDHQPPAAGEN